MSTEATEQPKDVEDTPRGRIWRAGTLTYTSGGLVALFFWLLWGDFTISLKDRSLTPTLQIMLRTFEAKAVVIALLLSFLPPLISIFLIPVVSYKSDRHRGAWGRRIPYLLIPTPIAFVTMVLLGFSPAIGKVLHNALGGERALMSENSFILLCIGVAWTLFEFANLTCTAVFTWLIADVVPRPLFGRFFGMFRALSLIAGMIFSWYLLGIVKTHYAMVFLAIGALYGVSFTIMCLKVKEGDYPPVQPMESSLETSRALASRFSAVNEYLRDCFTHPYYLWYFLSITLAHIGFLPINLYSLIFATSLGMSDKMYGHWSAIQLGCSLVQTYPLGWLADKIHPLRVTIGALALYALSTLWAFFFVRDASMFAAAHVICGTISGMWLTATAPLAPSLLPKSKFASYFSAMGICMAVAGMVMGPVVGKALDRLNPGRKIENYDFHTMYLWSSILMTLSLVVTLIVYRKFMQYGGPKHYVAPQ
ncbi:MAG TPA: MFS transporter [Tepidisphaeraceae bacterium]|jgi:hypothetical protein